MKIFVTLFAAIFLTLQLAQAQYMPHDGDIDSTFGVNGSFLLEDTNLKSYGLGVTVLSNDEIVVLTAFYDPFYKSSMGLIKLSKDGIIDTSFGIKGYSIFPGNFPSHGPLLAGIINDTGDRIIAIGPIQDTINKDTGFYICRYLPNGQLDTSFNHCGYNTAFFNNRICFATFIATQTDGKYLVAGQDGRTDSMRVARFNINGSLDSTFGDSNDGKLTIINTLIRSYFAFTIQSDNKMLLAGDGHLSNVLMRCYPNGIFDSTFGQYGNVACDANCQFTSLKVLPDNKILAAGDKSGSFVLSQFNSSGTLDSSFGVNGSGTIDITYANDNIAYCISVQTDGKIVLSGGSGITTRSQGVARFNSNGSTDVSFGVNGQTPQQLLAPYSSNFLDGMSLQSNGDIITTGYVDINELFVSRYIAHPNKLGIKSIEPQPTFTAYPNPSSGTYTISATSNTGSMALTVTDVLGKTILTTTFRSSTTIDLARYPTGMYFLKAATTTGTQTIKLLKQ